MPNNNDNEPENELDMFEALAAQIFGGTFSVMKEVMQGGTGHIMINDDQTAAGPPVWDDGSDFRRLAKTNGSKGKAISIESDNKEKSISDRRVESRRISLSNPDQPSTPVVSTSYQQPTPIFDLLFNSHPARLSEGDTVIFGGGNEGGSGWSFSSSSSRTTMLPDGSVETVITKSINGVTETIRKVENADGSIVETVESGKKRLDWKAPLQSIEDKMNKVWEDSKPEREQSMAELDRAASSLAKAYSGIRDGIFTRLWNSFAGHEPQNNTDRNPPTEK